MGVKGAVILRNNGIMPRDGDLHGNRNKITKVRLKVNIL